MPAKLTPDEVVRRLSLKNPNLIILNPEIIDGVYTTVTVKCKICGVEYQVLVNTLLQGNAQCLGCIGQIAIRGVNDIATTDPWMMEYLVDKEDAYKYKAQSGHKVLTKCPICGSIKLIQISKLHNRRWSCDFCSDHVSYPNKLSRGLLKQLPVTNVEYEYRPKWAKSYKYDNYFEYNNQSYILEMDGGLGHGNSDYKHHKDTEGIKTDKIKDDLAKEHNINVIRIDCLISDFDYIKNNILNSELSQLFDLNNIDWAECEKYTATSIVKEVCDYYMKHDDATTTDIQKKFDIGNSTAKRYLLKGTRLGLCDYTVEEGIKRGQKKRLKSKQNRTPKDTYVYYQGELINIYKTLTEAIKDLNNLYPEVNFNISSVTSKLNRDNNDIMYKNFNIIRKERRIS